MQGTRLSVFSPTYMVFQVWLTGKDAPTFLTYIAFQALISALTNSLAAVAVPRDPTGTVLQLWGKTLSDPREGLYITRQVTSPMIPSQHTSRELMAPTEATRRVFQPIETTLWQRANGTIVRRHIRHWMQQSPQFLYAPETLGPMTGEGVRRPR